MKTWPIKLTLKPDLGVILLLLLTMVLTRQEPLLAHGGGPIQIENEPLGMLQISAWLNPGQPQSHEIVHITVGISDDQRVPRLDSTVFVEILGTEGRVWQGFATTEQSTNRLFYEADIEPLLPGHYEVMLHIEDALGTGALSFPISVKKGSFLSGTYPFIVAGSLAAAGVIVWQRSKRYRQSVSRPTSRRPKRFVK